MSGSSRVAHRNMIAKIVFNVAAILLALAPTTARADEARETYDFQICHGYFALCAASTCTPTGRHIRVRTATGGTAIFPEADCKCPVLLGPSIANLAGGNMQGSCDPPGRGEIWSTYQPRPNIPQEITNWVPTLPEAAAPPLFCPKRRNLGSQLVNCFSFSCDSQTYINNVPVVTCHCPIGESLAGTAVPPHTSFLTQAGQGDRAFCADHPVAGPISFP